MQQQGGTGPVGISWWSMDKEPETISIRNCCYSVTIRASLASVSSGSTSTNLGLAWVHPGNGSLQQGTGLDRNGTCKSVCRHPYGLFRQPHSKEAFSLHAPCLWIQPWRRCHCSRDHVLLPEQHLPPPRWRPPVMHQPYAVLPQIPPRTSPDGNPEVCE